MEKLITMKSVFIRLNYRHLALIILLLFPVIQSQAQKNTVTAGRQFNFWNLKARNFPGNPATINVSEERTGAEAGYTIGYQRNFNSGWAAWLHAGFGNSFGPTEEFKINPPIQLSIDNTFTGFHMSGSKAGFLQLSAGASKKFKLVKNLRIGTSAGMGRQWHDASIDNELQTIYMDQNGETKVFKFGEIRGKNPDSMPFYLLGGLEVILFEGNFNIIFGAQFQYFLSDIYRTEALILMDVNSIEHAFNYDNSGIGWLMNIKAAYSF